MNGQQHNKAGVRLERILSHLGSGSGSDSPAALITPATTSAAENKRNTLTVIDNRTGKTIEVPVEHNTVLADKFKALTYEDEKDPHALSQLMIFDPAFSNTACCKSAISYIDGDKGILRYRGIPIEILAEKSDFLEVAYLLINGNLPTSSQFASWKNDIMTHTYLHENLTSLMKIFRYDAHPMGMVISSMAALSTFYPDANPALQGVDVFKNVQIRNKQIFRIIGKLPTIAACAYRHRLGRPYNEPQNNLSYTENLLYMFDRLNEKDYKPHPVLARALDVLFILHAEHELNCSTATMRQISSAGADPYSAVAGAAAALYGPLHGGANEAVLRMLQSIGSVENIPQFLEEVKAKKKKLMGFGHRVYKNYDPRAKIIRTVAYEVFSVVGKEPLIEIATELEKKALEDDYFVSRKLYPNVDFYSGVIYRAMGFPTDLFPVLFTIPRAVGWLAHWLEATTDPDARINRPRQIYVGESLRDFVPIHERPEHPVKALGTYQSQFQRRRSFATS